MSKFPSVDKVRYTKEQVRKATQRAALPDGIHCFLTGKGSRKVIESGDIAGTMIVEFPVNALRDPDDPSSTVRPGMKDSIFIPFDNPEWTGHKALSWMWGLAAQKLRALFDEKELPRVVFKDGEARYKGRAIDPDDVKGCEEEAMDLVAEKCMGLIGKVSSGDPDKPLKEIGNRLYFGTVGFRKKDTQKRYKNILDSWAELPEGETCASLDTDDVADAEPNQEPTRDRTRSKKKAKKKTKGRR